MSHASEVSLPGDAPLFVLTRIFDAPRALVYTCWMDPKHLAHWWGPKSFTCPVCEVDARVGGEFRMVMSGPDGSDYPMRGNFREIVPNVRIVKEDDVSEHSEAWHDMVDPDRKGQGKRKIDMLTTVTFEDHGTGTRVTITTRFPSIALRDGFARTGMKEGWSSSLEKLEDLVNALKGSRHEINMTRLVKHPVERVFAAFSNPAGMAHWWGPDGFTTTTKSMQFKVGGAWDYVMHGPDGTDYPNFVRYISIETNRRIAYDHGSHAEHPALFKAVITFEPQAGATRVTLRLILSDANQRPDYVAFGAVEGGYQNLARLEAWLSSQ